MRPKCINCLTLDVFFIENGDSGEYDIIVIVSTSPDQDYSKFLRPCDYHEVDNHTVKVHVKNKPAMDCRFYIS